MHLIFDTTIPPMILPQKNTDFTLKVVGGELSAILEISDAIEVSEILYFYLFIICFTLKLELNKQVNLCTTLLHMTYKE